MPAETFTPEESAALKASFLRLVPKSDAFAESLYEHLFKSAPHLRSLFAPSMDEQYYKLVRMLAMLVDAVEDRETFERECRASGERHKYFGVEPSHYPLVGDAILAALREHLQPSSKEERLWLRLYVDASRLMIEGE